MPLFPNNLLAESPLSPSPLSFLGLEGEIILTTHAFYQFFFAHFVIDYLSLLGIASFLLANMFITLNV
jgi:hypothetical protein